MGQQPHPYEDEDDLEELGTPVYDGSGLSVRALTAEELQRFLDAHTDQAAELLGSGWAALDPPRQPSGVPRTPPVAEPEPPRPQPWAPSEPVAGSPGRPGRSALSRGRRPSQWPAARAARAARPSPSTGGGAARSWPPGPAA
jgi:hypothetical protein